MEWLKEWTDYLTGFAVILIGLLTRIISLEKIWNVLRRKNDRSKKENSSYIRLESKILSRLRSVEDKLRSTRVSFDSEIENLERRITENRNSIEDIYQVIREIDDAVGDKFIHLATDIGKLTGLIEGQFKGQTK